MAAADFVLNDDATRIVIGARPGLAIYRTDALSTTEIALEREGFFPFIDWTGPFITAANLDGTVTRWDMNNDGISTTVVDTNR